MDTSNSRRMYAAVGIIGSDPGAVNGKEREIPSRSRWRREPCIDRDGLLAYASWGDDSGGLRVRLGLRILFVLLFLRLMAPPGICLCKLNASAILFPQGTVPSESDEPDDDHAPGCPCSPLAAGMGLRVPVESAPVPVLSFKVAALPFGRGGRSTAVHQCSSPPSSPSDPLRQLPLAPPLGILRP